MTRRSNLPTLATFAAAVLIGWVYAALIVRWLS